MIRAFQFGNPGTVDIVVSVEPWCDELNIPPGGVLTLRCQYDEERHPPTIEAHPWGIWFAPECIDYTADLNGQSIPL